MKLFA